MRISEHIINEDFKLNPIIVSPEMKERGRIKDEEIQYKKDLIYYKRELNKIIKVAPQYNKTIKDLLDLKEIQNICFKYPEIHIFLKYKIKEGVKMKL